MINSGSKVNRSIEPQSFPFYFPLQVCRRPIRNRVEMINGHNDIWYKNDPNISQIQIFVIYNNFPKHMFDGYENLIKLNNNKRIKI